jgi:hypothetical protein
MDRPDVRYAHNGDVAIAYQVFGEGPISLVCVPGFISNLYWNWELPEFSRMLTGLGSFARRPRPVASLPGAQLTDEATDDPPVSHNAGQISPRREPRDASAATARNGQTGQLSGL